MASTARTLLWRPIPRATTLPVRWWTAWAGCGGPGGSGGLRSALEPLQPGGRGRVVGVGGADLDDRLRPVGPGIAAQEHHVAADPVQAHQRLGQPGVVDVALGVHREAVVAEGALGRPRLDPAQVDPAAGELLE